MIDVIGGPTVLISYSHDSPEHQARVAALARRFRSDGIKVVLDQDVPYANPSEGWPTWMETQILRAGFVLMVCTPTYWTYTNQENTPETGLGVLYEARLIRQLICNSGALNQKFIPVLLASSRKEDIPITVQGQRHYLVEDNEDYTELLRRLREQEFISQPKEGNSRPPPAIVRLHSESQELFDVPRLPPNYVARQDVLELPKDALIRRSTLNSQFEPSDILGLHGMGGVGKTVLAVALARDPEILTEFSEGIYWVSLGQNPNILDAQKRLAHHLNEDPTTITSEQQGRRTLRHALTGRKVLLVLDDVCKPNDAEWLTVTTYPARTLVTSRNRTLVLDLGGYGFSIDVLDRQRALSLLAAWADIREAVSLPTEAAEIVQECGCLPLAIAMVGAIIRFNGYAWGDLLGKLKRSDLDEIKRIFPRHPNPDLLRAIEVCVNELEPDLRSLYMDLAVFPKDHPIPVTALTALWRLGKAEASMRMTEFVWRSLARSSFDQEAAITLHSLQWDFVHNRTKNSIASVHNRLLVQWPDWRILRDSYAWRWYGYHLAAADRKHELRSLLLNMDYLYNKVEYSDVHSLLAEFQYCDDQDAASGDDDSLSLVKSAILLSAHVLDRNKDQLGSQLLGRLTNTIGTNVGQLLQRAAEGHATPSLIPLTASLTLAGGSLVRILESDSDDVPAVAITPDGRCCVAAFGDVLKIWDLPWGHLLQTLEGHTSAISTVAVNESGTLVASGSWDKTVRVWRISDGQCLHIFTGHKREVQSVAMIEDGKHVISGGADGKLRIWDTKSAKCQKVLTVHKAAVDLIAMSRNARWLIAGTRTKGLQLWDLENRSRKVIFDTDTHGINCVVMSHDGKYFVCGSHDGTMQICAALTGACTYQYEKQQYAFNSIAMASDAPEGQKIVSGCSDQHMRTWRTRNSVCAGVFRGHSKPISSVAVSRDGRWGVSGSSDRTLRVWNLRNRLHAADQENLIESVDTVAISKNDNWAISWAGNGLLRAWDLSSLTSEVLRCPDAQKCMFLALVPGIDKILLTCSGRTLQLWNLNLGQCCGQFQSYVGDVRSAAVTLDGRHILSGSADMKILLWDVLSQTCLAELNGHEGAVSAVAIASNGRFAVSAAHDLTLRQWDLVSGAELRTLTGHFAWIDALALSADGRIAVSASDDKTLRVWDLQQGRCLRQLSGHEHYVKGVAITRDDRWIISASFDRSIRIWSLQTGDLIARFDGDSPFTSCAVTGDGRIVMAGDQSGRVHFLRPVNLHD